MATKKESPMMRQFRYLKSKHPDALLLFRCGDFYETYEADAKECAKVLGITLTKCMDGTAMAGFPHHALDTYLPRLIRAGKRVAICDQLDPPLTPRVKRGVTENINSTNNSKSTTMETKNMTAQDYVGKTINVKDSTNYYEVKSADGDTLQTLMHMGERVMPCPMPMTLLSTMLEAGKYIIGAAAPATAEPVVEKPEPVAEKPTAQTVTPKPTATEPKKSKRQTKQPKPTKSVKPEAETETKAKLRYETYTNKKGKTCARIVGFTEGDAILERGNAERIHASSTYERKKCMKNYMLIFGPRYADAAKVVCQALNEGKTLADCKAIIDAATEERVQKREEWKAKRATYIANRENGGTEVKSADVEETKGYSSEDVAAMLKKIMAGGAIPEEIKRAMAA